MSSIKDKFQRDVRRICSDYDRFELFRKHFEAARGFHSEVEGWTGAENQSLLRDMYYAILNRHQWRLSKISNIDNIPNDRGNHAFKNAFKRIKGVGREDFKPSKGSEYAIIFLMWMCWRTPTQAKALYEELNQLTSGKGEELKFRRLYDNGKEKDEIELSFSRFPVPQENVPPDQSENREVPDISPIAVGTNTGSLAETNDQIPASSSIQPVSSEPHKKSKPFAFFKRNRVPQAEAQGFHAENRIKLSFPPMSEVEQLRETFRKISAGLSAPLDNAKSKQGQWSVVKQWDASRPNSGSVRRRHNLPRSLAWKPDNRSIGVACHAFGHSITHVDIGPRTNLDFSSNEYGEPRFSFWSSDGTYFASSGDTGQTNYWTISFGPNNRIGTFPRVFEPFGFESFNLHAKYNFMRGRDPFRPGYQQLTITPWQPFYVGVFELGELGKLDGTKKTEWNKHCKYALDFSPLGALENECYRYQWHQSGLYIAVTTCGALRSEAAANSSHVVEFHTGKIIASVRDGYCAIAWSPCGTKLLTFKRRDARDRIGESDVFRLLDVVSNTVQESKIAADFGLWAKRAGIQNVPYGKAVNVKGDRVFKCLTLVPDGRFALQIINIEGDEERVELEIEGPVADASWSHTDPNCFATAGGEGFEREVRIWRVE